MVLFEIGIIVAVIALICEYVDSTLGMGYGTTLTPILLLMGFEPLQIVPAVLLSELITGFFAAGMHHAVGNAHFGRKSEDLKIALVLGACSIIGVIIAVLIAINLPSFYVKVYIGFIVTAMGALIIWKRNRERVFSWIKIVGLGVVAAFNKGISGGGYGPLVVSGQILSGVKGKKAVAITSLSEGLTCVAGVALYFFTNHLIDWQLAPFLVAGAALSVPLSAFSVKKIDHDRLTLLIGLTTLVLGIFTLWKVVG